MHRTTPFPGAGPQAFLVVLAAEALRALRLRAAWGIAAGVVGLSLLAFLLEGHPFRVPGLYALQSFAGLNQLGISLLVGAMLLTSPGARGPEWWPLPSGLAVVARSLGGWAGTAGLLLVVWALQLGLAWAGDDLEAPDPLSPDPVALGPRYARLLPGMLLFALVLHAWASLLLAGLPRGAALLALFVLVLTGFLVAHMWADYGPLRPLLVLVPDLAAVSPLAAAAEPPPALGPLLLYTAIHLGCIWSLATVILAVLASRRRAVEKE